MRCHRLHPSTIGLGLQGRAECNLSGLVQFDIRRICLLLELFLPVVPLNVLLEEGSVLKDFFFLFFLFLHDSLNKLVVSV